MVDKAKQRKYSGLCFVLSVVALSLLWLGLKVFSALFPGMAGGAGAEGNVFTILLFCLFAIAMVFLAAWLISAGSRRIERLLWGDSLPAARQVKKGGLKGLKIVGMSVAFWFADQWMKNWAADLAVAIWYKGGLLPSGAHMDAYQAVSPWVTAVTGAVALAVGCLWQGGQVARLHREAGDAEEHILQDGSAGLSA